MKTRWQDWINLVFGAWLFFSPWLLQYATVGTASWNSFIFGVAIVVFAVWALFVPRTWEELTNFVLGAWLIISPWVLGFSMDKLATWNLVVVGAVVAAISGITALRQQPPGTAAKV
jgi:hypothetical protein